jgi:hypothetical protein
MAGPLHPLSETTPMELKPDTANPEIAMARKSRRALRRESNDACA